LEAEMKLTFKSFSIKLDYVIKIYVFIEPQVTAPTLHFTMEEEFKHNTNFLDIISSKDHNNIMFSIHRKPTATNMIIPNDSCHPQNTQWKQLDI
jgi:hypothetical protein